MRKEIWRIVPGWDNYMVSDLGRVKCLNFNHTGKEGMLKLKKRQRDGRLEAPLKQDGKRWDAPVHRLVALVFIPNPENKPQVHHINNDFTDNRVENLIWVTPEEHMALHNEDGIRNKKISEAKTNGKTSKKVRQMTPERVEITIWPSLREIERSLGYSHGSLCRAIKEHRIAYGCLWEFVENC